MAFIAQVDTSDIFITITLSDSLAGTQAEIYSFGALLNKFQIQIDGAPLNIVDGFASPNDAIKEMEPAFKSAFLSPFTCRMNEGKYALDNKNYQVEKFFLPPHAIHGLVYDAIFTLDKTEETDGYAAVHLSYTYNKEDAGYPFSYTVSHVWKLEAGNKLSVTSTVAHQNNHAIPYAQGWHPYFTLGPSVNECTLQFTTDKQVAFDETLLPTGAITDDGRFTKGAVLEGIFLDNCFHLAGDAAHSCVLKNNKVTLTITPDKTYPYLQIYTPPHRNSIAIENLSGAPDCFNNGLGLLLIEPNTPTIFATTYLVTPV